MKKLFILNLLIYLLTNVQAQLRCDMVEPENLSEPQLKTLSGPCDIMSNYSLDQNPEHTPIKTLRIAFDIIQRNDVVEISMEAMPISSVNLKD